MRSSSLILSALFTTCVAATASAQCPQGDSQRIDPGDDPPNALFGTALDVDGDTLVVGAPHALDSQGRETGAVYVYARAANGWVETAKLVHNNPRRFDRFGESVDLDGDRLVVGAAGRDDSCQFANLWCQSGGAYVFERSGGVWSQRAKLTAEPNADNLNFGHEVALSGSLLAVSGARPSEPSLFSIYLYEEIGGVWTFTGFLPVPPGRTHFYGGELALEGERLVVGDLGVNVQAGVVHVYERNGGQWSRADLTPASSSSLWAFGYSVSLDGGRLAIGAPNATADDHGRVYLFDLIGGAWTETEWVTHAEPLQDRRFGTDVALDDGRLVVAQSQYVNNPNRQVFVLREDPVLGWVDAAVLETNIGWNNQQSAVAVQDGVAFVSDPRGDPGAPHLTQTGVVWSYDARPGARYCSAGPNSTGAPALMDAWGCTGAAAATLTLSAGPVPSASFGLFFCGELQASVPLGNGTRCVDAGPGGLLRLPVTLSSAQGRLTSDVVFAGALGSALQPGTTWNFQAWFRDTAAGGAGFDLSDGLSITFMN